MDVAPGERPPETASAIKNFLLARSSTFRELSELRDQGWASKAGDEYFKHQRESADTAPPDLARHFFNMMQKIGDQIQTSTSLFSLPTIHQHQPRVLDLCMAPGGYTASCLKYTPTASIVAICLPVSNGGHAVLFPHGPQDSRVQCHFFDLTMLNTEFCPTTPIPADHPDASSFLLATHPLLSPSNTEFDLIICDGQVLRTHSRSSYRAHREGTRLTTSQLILALGRIRTDKKGKMLILLHKLESLRCTRLLHQFSQFSGKVTLFKPRPYHAKRSSFYMVAEDVDSGHPVAVEAVRGWREEWRRFTLALCNWEGEQGEGEKGGGERENDFEAEAAELIASFGARLVELGDPIWAVQRDALRKAPFMARKIGEKDSSSREWRPKKKKIQWRGSAGRKAAI